MLSSVGIIGGADGPTALFVTGDPVSGILSTALAVLIVIFVFKHIRKQ